MPKDIRSYFTPNKIKDGYKKNIASRERLEKPSQSKRPIIIDSDSDDESDKVIVKRNKSSTNCEKCISKEKNEVKKITKYDSSESVRTSDIYGSKPIKRDNSRNIIKAENNSDSSVYEKTVTLEKNKNNEEISSKKIRFENNKDHFQLEKKNSQSQKTKESQNDSKKEFPTTLCPLGNVSSQSSPKNSTFLDQRPSAELKKCSPNDMFRRDEDLDSHIDKNISHPISETNKKCIENQISVMEVDKSIVTNSSQNHCISVNVNKTDGIVKTTSNSCYKLWVEKYKPTTSKHIIGQHGDKSCVSKLTSWLKNWANNQSGNKKVFKTNPWNRNDDGSYFKAALLSGPPGVGKTTTAHLVSRELGFDVVEFNASDTRSKKLLHQEVSELLSSNSLSPFFMGKEKQITKKHVLLMDEVDGMAGNEDRGGVQELIQLIKQSRIPIICLCNDRNHPKIRSLANYCFDLRFTKPRAEQIKGAMMSVCFKENLKLEPHMLTEIINSANQDIRLIMNHLSMLSIENSNLTNSTKHIKMGPWDVVRKIFSEEEHKSLSIFDKCDLFFHDYNIIPLFVQENYIHAVVHKPEYKSKIKKMEMFAVAARSLSIGDLTEKRIRSHNAWSLLPVQAIFTSLVPGEILEGHIGAQINFPSWFGKTSRQTKMSRFIQELTVHSRLKISGNKEAMNLDYVKPLEDSIVSPLVKYGLDGIPQALSVLREYSLVREDLESLTELASWQNSKTLFSEVESKIKAAFTRACNKNCTFTPYSAVSIKKSRKTDVPDSDIIAETEDGVLQDLEDEEEDSLEVDTMIVVKKKQPSKKLDKAAMQSRNKGSKVTKKGKKN